MAIQWYPGHMHKANKEIKLVMPKTDLIIEVLDARIPYSSENPEVNKLRGNKPCIKLLNKADLADPLITQQWIDYFQAERNIKARAVSREQPDQIKQTLQLCRQFFPDRNLTTRPIQVLIMGIPNVGKSSIINILSGRTIAKVGNEPAVTKRQQKIILENGIQLMDTPGFLWPKIHNENTGYRLAITGAIKSTAMEYDDVALYAADYFLKAYPDLLMQRYKLKTLPKNDMDALESIGRNRGCLQGGGTVNLHKAAELLLNEFRSKQLGAISLETPEMAMAEIKQMENK
ncbi:MAG: ribosome biogenesis GTPase YlqF [Gammaproteobacteria bacterium]|nr:ribosome biogenesis GTPase YlqF [Gammaproteobacteria bacterium]MCW8909601.1 ribosome biogenesis GTPase YlqF [Gammaproteobacteria bacterium]MCW9004378.1 ribosome biogenesis GTPase YlqF [Gammaproteobacteria bacterium]MCW9056529.1 ribosome biogenesis GTPase YlqF [Gammaproteobacteria bacterium]